MTPFNALFQLFRSDYDIPDPGDTKTIYANKQLGVVSVTTAAAETRVLDQPTKEGILCTIGLDTDGGDLTLTVTGGYNADADTAIVFADAGDFVMFQSIKVGSSYYWRVVAQEGTDAVAEDFAVDQLAATTLTVGGGAAVTLHDLAISAGVGITGAADNFASKVEKIGTLFKTTIVIDIDGLNCGGTAGDIIGDDGTGVAHLGQITAARSGTIFAGTVTCIEAPTGGDPDIDLWSAVEDTGVEDTAISALDETQLCNSGDLAAGSVIPLTAYPAADEYLYLVCGVSTDATYTAGIVCIELWGK